MEAITCPYFSTFPARSGIALGGIMKGVGVDSYVISNINVMPNSFKLHQAGSIGGYSGSLCMGFYEDGSVWNLSINQTGVLWAI